MTDMCEGQTTGDTEVRDDGGDISHILAYVWNSFWRQETGLGNPLSPYAESTHTHLCTQGAHEQVQGGGPVSSEYHSHYRLPWLYPINGAIRSYQLLAQLLPSGWASIRSLTVPEAVPYQPTKPFKHMGL